MSTYCTLQSPSGLLGPCYLIRELSMVDVASEQRYAKKISKVIPHFGFLLESIRIQYFAFL